MGPLVTRAHVDRVLDYVEAGERAGAELVVDGRGLRVAGYEDGHFLGPTLFDHVTRDMSIYRDEIFGPEAALYPIDDLDAAITAVNDSDYGLAASVFTRDRARYERCVGRIRTGILNWNKGTVGASGRLPFGGSGRSGNNRPAGITATLYCASPQSHLESEAGFDPDALPPGMPRP